MTDLEAFKTKSDVAVSWLSLIGVGAAVLFGISEYQESASKRIDDAQRTTLEFISRYNQEGVLQARSDVQRSIDTLGEALSKKLAGVTSLEAINEIVSRHYREQTSAQLRSDESYQDALLVVRFFDELFVCVDTGLCERNSAERFFTDEAYQYHLVMQAEIERIQLTRPRFGLGLEQMRVSSSTLE
ncbi:hypothetical protein [Shimia marina]|uniref:DUF4760 domain-containing protein n=1 Tax=Shimia marina TaxID=321267 RepID=A0A0P1EQY0_9RHOB|nr:hypothetical protein [Shimia marina]CUH52669.1 hypothetical protein SHM7688_02116 [Shimia marina]SFE74900.1 hypothetical protein SAMN04488037_1191 [Shimia marina]